MTGKLRLLMMGTGSFAVPTLQGLLASKHEVLGLVTRPVRTGPGSKAPPPSPMRELAERVALTVWDPGDANGVECRQLVERLRPSLLVVCDYGQILSGELLGLARFGGINLHGSLLPAYRGAAPINWALYHGERRTGVTVIHMTPGLDAGPILERRELEIDPQDDAVTLEAKLALLGPEAVLSALERIARWDGLRPLGEPQDAKRVSRARRLRKQDGRLDWKRPARNLADQVRALKPWPGSYTYWQRPGKPAQRWILTAVEPECGDSGPAGRDRTDAGTGLAEPGTIVGVDRSGIAVATGDGLLYLNRVQPAGKREMTVEQLLRGYPIEPGQKLVDGA